MISKLKRPTLKHKVTVDLETTTPFILIEDDANDDDSDEYYTDDEFDYDDDDADDDENEEDIPVVSSDPIVFQEPSKKNALLEDILQQQVSLLEEGLTTLEAEDLDDTFNISLVINNLKGIISEINA